MQYNKNFKQLFLIIISMLYCSISQSSEWQYNIALSYITADIKVNKLPLEIRNVPIHPDDTYVPASNAGPVAQQQYSIDGTLNFELRFKKALKTTGSKVGIAIQWILYPTAALYNHALRNYSNAVGTEQRGVGAALTFVGLEKRGLISDFNSDTWDDLLLNFTPELFIETPFSDSVDLITAISYYQLQAVTGWDRFDALEERDHFTLAQVFPISVAVKIEHFRMGIVYPVIASKSNYGKTADIKSNISLLLAYSW